MPDQVYETETGWRVTYNVDTREGTATLGNRRIVAPFTVSEYGTVMFRPDDEVPMYASLEVRRWITETVLAGCGSSRDEPGRTEQT